MKEMVKNVAPNAENSEKESCLEEKYVLFSSLVGLSYLLTEI